MSAPLAFGEADDGKGAAQSERRQAAQEAFPPRAVNMLKCGRRIGAVRMLSKAKAASPTKRAMAEQRLKEAVVDGLVKERVIPVPKTLLEHYARLLQERPLLTNAATSGILCAAGDLLAQLIEWRASARRSRHLAAISWSEGTAELPPVAVSTSTSFDAARTGRMAIYGFFVCGPLLTGWYKGLNAISEALRVSYKPAISWLPFSWYKEAPGTSPAKLLATKVLADTLFFQAPFLTLYFGVMGLLEGQTFAKTFEKTKESFHRAWALSLLVWTPVQCVNLFYVPASWQPFVVSAVNVGWKSTLSLLNQYHTEAAPSEEEIDRELEVAELRADLLALRAQLTFLQVENDDFRRREAERRFSWMRAWRWWP